MTSRQSPDRMPAVGRDEAERPVVCPFCSSAKTELHSLFGNMQLASQYYCHTCNTVFEAILWQDREPPD